MLNKNFFIILLLIGLMVFFVVSLFKNKQIRNNTDRCTYISIVFDDGYLETYYNFLPLIKKYNISSTFFIISSLVGKKFEGRQVINWSKVKRLQELGQEIGDHTLSHLHLTKLSNQEIVKELSFSKEIFKKQGIIVKDLAIPYGDHNERVINIAKNYYSLIRSSDLGYNKINNLDRYNLKAFFVTKTTDFQTIKKWIDGCHSNSWLTLGYHLLEKDNNSNYEYTTSVKLLENTIKYIKSKNIPIKPISYFINF